MPFLNMNSFLKNGATKIIICQELVEPVVQMYSVYKLQPAGPDIWETP